MADPRLKAAIAANRFVVAPGIFDMISARLADRMGFRALYATGYGTVASHLGVPDAGIATYTDMVARMGRFAQGCRTPVICDADTGYGGLLNVRHTVMGYEAAGVAAIQLEDQEVPKKCGHTPGRRVIPAEEMALKIEVAVEARKSEDFLGSPAFPVPRQRSHAACRTRARRSSNPARPYMVRLIILMRPIWPSAGLVVQGSVSAASTALTSLRSSATKPASCVPSAAARRCRRQGCRESRAGSPAR